jgi:hypothetical protein
LTNQLSGVKRWRRLKMTVYWKKGDGDFLCFKDGEKIEDLIFFLSKKNEKNDHPSIELTPQDLYAVWNLGNAKELMKWLIKRKLKDPRFKDFLELICARSALSDLVKSGKIKAEKINEMFMFFPTETGKEVFEKYFKK